MLISILCIKNYSGNTLHLYGIDINPMNPLEFIVNGDDEYVRMYDKRKLSLEPVKTFNRVLETSYVSRFIVIKCN